MMKVPLEFTQQIHRSKNYTNKDMKMMMNKMYRYNMDEPFERFPEKQNSWPQLRGFLFFLLPNRDYIFTVWSRLESPQ